VDISARSTGVVNGYVMILPSFQGVKDDSGPAGWLEHRSMKLAVRSGSDRAPP